MLNSIQDVAHYTNRVYNRVLNSIAFYPILISLGFMALAIVLTIVGFDKYEFLSDTKLPFLTITDSEITQTILSTIIGGILSLTVFSFSMVMVVLSQASSNFSPRLLPGLISDKKHQAILGIYTGTLLYAFIILINLGALAGRDSDLGLATMLGAIFGVCCVVLFVYFIHSISQSIQIDNIIQQICSETLQKLNTLIENQELSEGEEKPHDTFFSEISGYYRGFNSNISEEYLDHTSIRIEILPFIDKYVWKGDPLFRITKDVSKELKEQVSKNFHLSADKHDSREYLGGMTKLMEVAVKALSPGINDPGTAIDAIIKLGELMRLAFKIHQKVGVETLEDTIELVQYNIGPKELMRIVVQPIQHYGQKDFSVLCVLVESLNSIRGDNEISNEAKKAVEKQLDLLRKNIVATGHHETNKAHFENLFTATRT